MIRLNGSCSIPLALWDSEPPDHKISSLLVTPDSKYLVTGDHEGRLITWNITTSKIEPLLCLIAHRGKITALCLSVGSTNDKKPYFVSATDTGEIALWDLEEGRCIEFRIDWRYIHTDIQSHQPLYQEPTILLACGRYPELVLLHSTSLTRLVSLVSRSHIDWIHAFTIFSHPKSKEDVVVGLSMQGTVIVWTLNGSEIHDSTKQEEESKPLNCVHIIRLLCNPFSPRVILVVTSFEAKIYDGIDWCVLCSIEAPHGEAFTNGLFLKSNHILLSTTGENFLIYRLPNELFTNPNTSTPGHPNFRKNIQNVDRPSIVLTLNAPQKGDGDSPSVENCLKILQTKAGIKGVNILLANNRGQIGIWKVDDKYFHTTDTHAKKFRCDLNFSTSLQSVWKESSLFSLSACVQNVIPSLSLSGQSTPIPMTTNSEYNSSLLNGENKSLDMYASPTPQRVTTLTLLHKENRIAVGLESGDIIIFNTLDMIISVMFSHSHQASPASVQHLVGHKAAVTCLLHPASSPPRYSGIVSDLTGKATNPDAPPMSGFPFGSEHAGNSNQNANPFASIYNSEANRCLISGSEDYTVKVWDLGTGVCVLSLVLHAAPVIALVMSPVSHSTVTKIVDSVCSVGADHSVSLFNPWRREVFLISGHHSAAVTSLGWHSDQGFLMVSYQDESLFIWEIATGLLDRSEGGHTAIEILSNCPHVTRIRTPQGQPMHLTLKRSRGSSRSSQPFSLLAVQSMDSCQPTGAFIFYFDVEALIMSVLSTEKNNHLAQFNLGDDDSTPQNYSIKQSLTNRKRSLTTNGQSTFNNSANPELHRQLSRNQTNQLLLQVLASFLHPWKLNSTLDQSCCSALGLMEPQEDLCFGTLSRYNCLALQMPKQQQSMCDSLSRWSVSSCMSTQFMLAAMSLQQTVTSLTDRLFCDWTPLAALINNAPIMSSANFRAIDFDQMRHNNTTANINSESALHDQESSIRQTWLMAATILCTDLQDLLSSKKYRKPFLQLFAQCWQDRCLQIREAAQTLLYCVLDRLGDDGRKSIVEDWAGHLPAPGQLLHEDQSGGSLLLECDWWIKIPGFWITESQRHSLQCTAVIMMGVIGARYGHILSSDNTANSSTNNVGSSKAQEGFGLDNYYLARCTSRALTALVMQTKNPSAQVKSSQSANQIGRDSPEFSVMTSANVDPFSSLHRSALDLIGRGFAVWEPYLEVGPLLTKILEVSAGSTKLLAGLKQTSNTICNLDTCEPLNPAVDTGRTARQALCLIASARPKAYIVTLSREVLRYSGHNTGQSAAAQPANAGSAANVSASSNTTNDSSAPASNAPGSSQINSTAGPMTECPLIAASLEVIQSLQLICAKKSSVELNDVVGEVVDILLICLDKKMLCEAGLTELFPSIKRFPTVASNTQAQKVVVGNMNGVVSFYDYKIGKYQTIQAHRGPISCVSLSNDGKYAASYSTVDNMIKTWQPSSTGFFGIGTPQARLLASHAIPPASQNSSHSTSIPNLSPLSQSHSHFLQWVEPRLLHILSTDGHLVSKIKV